MMSNKLFSGKSRQPRQRHILHVWGLVVVLAAFFSVMAHLLWSGYVDAVRATEKSTLDLANLYESHLNASLRRADAVLLNMTLSLPPIYKTLAGGEMSRAAVAVQVENHVIGFEEVTGVYLVDARGMLRYASDSSLVDIDLADRDYFYQLRDRPAQRFFISDVLTARTTGKATVMLARPVLGAKGEFLGVVGLAMNLDFLGKLLASSVLRNSQLAIRRIEDGRLVVRNYLEDADENTVVPDGLIQKVIGSGQVQGSYTENGWIGGSGRILGFRKVAAYPWVVVVGTRKGDAMVDWQSRGSAILAIMLFMGCGGLLLIRALNRAHQEILDVVGEMGKLSLAVEQNPNSVVITDLEGNIEYVNLGFCNNTGYVAEEVVGQNARLLKSGQTPIASFESMWQSLLEGRSWKGEFINRSKGGELQTNFAHVLPLRQEDGSITNYVSIQEDITEKKRQGDELKRYRLHLEELVKERTSQLLDANAVLLRHHAEIAELYNDAPCGYHSLDSDGRFIRINDTELAWLGYRRDEVERELAFGELLATHDQAAFSAHFAQLRDSNVVSVAQYDMVRRDGSLLPVQINSRPVRDADGRFLHSLATVIDNTERKLWEQHITTLNEALAQRARDLEAATQVAESANRSKSVFLSNMSHEIRTPMSAIIGMTYLLRREVSGSKPEDYLNKISAAAQHLLGIINDILDISKIEAGKLVLEQMDINLHAVFGNVTSLIAQRAQEKGLLLSCYIDPRIPAVLQGDPLRLGQVLLNFAGNAVKFTESGAIEIRASLIELHGEHIRIRFTVEDHGIGISAADQVRLFTPFEQADGSTTRKYGGTGLGLAICQKLTQLMHGEVGVESVQGKGSLFWFTARLGCRPAGSGRPSGVIAETLAEDHAEQILLHDYHGRRILLAEDNLINQEVIREFLTDIGMLVDTADNGAVAVDLAARRDYDLILMDMQMPEMGGIEATRLIRCRPGGQQVPIVALTANAFEEDRERCLAAGMDDFLGKPVNPERFFATLLRWLTVGKRLSSAAAPSETAT